MSSRRPQFHSNKGSHHIQHNGSRNQSNRDNRNQQHRYQAQRSAALFVLNLCNNNLAIKEQQTNSRNEPQSVQLLRRIIEDEDDNLFAKRVADANQLLDILENARTAHSDTLEFRQEQMRLLDLCIHEEGLQRIVEFPKAPLGLKSSLLEIVSGLACYTRLDLALSWIFDRLSIYRSLESNSNTTVAIDATLKDKEVEWKKWLLRLLKQILIDSSADRYTYKQLLEMSPVILNSIIAFLDTMDSVKYLPLVIDLLTHFASNHEDLFSEKFKDVIDLLVGWNMDGNIPESTKTTITNLYTSFEPYWKNHIPFAVELLTYFLNDMQSTLKELKENSTCIDLKEKECNIKWKACNNLLTLVPEQTYSISREQKFNMPFRCFKTILDVILPQFANSGKAYIDPKIINIALEKLLSGMLSVLYEAQDLKPEFTWLQTYEQAYIEALLKFLELWNHDIDKNIAYHLLNMEYSPILQMKNHHTFTKRRKQIMLIILRFLIRVSLTETTQQQIVIQYLEELQKHFRALKCSVAKTESNLKDSTFFPKTSSFIETADIPNIPKDKELNVETPHRFGKPMKTVHSTVENIMFLTYILFDMAMTWPKLRLEISMTLVKLFCIAYINRWIKVYIPYFELLKEFWTSMNFMVEDEAGLKLILNLLEDFLLDNWLKLNMSIRRSLCQIVYSLLISLGKDAPTQKSALVNLIKPIVDGLFRAGDIEIDVAVKTQILAILSFYNRNFDSTHGHELGLRLIERSLGHPNQQIRTACIDFLCSLNPFILTSMDKMDDNFVNSLQRLIMATTHTGSFRPVHYEIVASHLGMVQYLVLSDQKQQQNKVTLMNKEREKDSVQWIRRLFHHCDTVRNMQNLNLTESITVADQYTMANAINNNEQLLTYWALWESARYCILSRLRTPFGGPQQTFGALEHMLQALIDGPQRDDEKRVEYLKQLLLLLDRLEVQIANAVDGCATGVLPAVPKSSLIFFKTNQKTCKDYFSRIRPNMIMGAKKIGNNHLLIYHSIKILTDLECKAFSCTDCIPVFEEINSYMRDLVRVCIDEHYTDFIHGLQSWFKKLIKTASQSVEGFKDNWAFDGLIGPHRKVIARENSKINIDWFQVAALFASGYDEMAIKALSTLKQFHGGNDQFGLLRMLTEKMIDFYASLEDYESLQQCLTEFKSHSATGDDCLLEAIKQFSDTSSNSSEAYIQDQQALLTKLNVFLKSSPTLKDLTQFSKLDKLKQSVFDVDPSIKKNVITMLSENITTMFKVDSTFTDLLTSILELQLSKTDGIVAKLKKNAVNWMSTDISRIDHLPKVYDTKQWSRLCAAFKKICVQQLHRDIAVIDDPHATHSWGYMQLFTATIARKQGNIMLADRLIKESIDVPDTKYQSLLEQSKLLFAQSKYIDAIKGANLVLSNIRNILGYSDLEKKTLMEIAFYLKCCLQQQPDVIEPMLQQLTSLASVVKNDRMPSNEMVSAVDLTIDYVLEQTINEEQEGKPWFEYATHHYKQGWRIMDDVLRKDGNTTTVVEWARKKLENILREKSENQEPNLSEVINSIFSIWNKHSSHSGSEENLTHLDSLTAEICKLLPSYDQTEIEDVMSTLKTVQDMVLNNFHASTDAYFRYLSLATSKKNDASNETTSMSVTAALRLLRILTKYGESLRQTFEKHVETAQIKLWKLIIPQLFAQLNHHNSFVQSTVTKIILRICEEYPSDIIYDVIVNSVSVKTKESTKQYLRTIASRMIEKSQMLWASTSRMVEELEKITVLLEEKWLNKIASMQYEVIKQFSILESEMHKTETEDADNIITNEAGVAGDKEAAFWSLYHNLMNPIITSMKNFFTETKLRTDSGVLTSTPHEEWFWNTYGTPLSRAQKLLEEPDNINDYRRGWEYYQQVYRQLMADTNKVRVLELNQISPYLSELRDAPIGMPGISQNADVDGACFIRSFDTSVIVLPTKTKPKKLNLNGSNGQKYTYLFKGLEDLHLDERIMQLLTTTNGLLKENRTTALRGMRSRTYAVIPLSDHSGMIQWVNDATPLFSLYKKWQKREMTAYTLMNNGVDKNDTMIRVLQQRPTDNFMGKVASVLKASGLKVTANRRHWPMEVLKKVHIELVKETPDYLLESELYYSSSNATEWFKKSTSFARSLAVTSIIGYVIGLGDRHLDNILVDFQSGEIIHIDYNVCFEKGLLLRVPELVPYRLTQNLYKVLGIVGTEGQFKTAAEETLRVLRKHKEVLITLLDAFVYDPLVDWENEVVGEAGNQRMADLQIHVTALATRIIEKQAEHEELRMAINEAIQKLEIKLYQWQESKLLEAESLVVDADVEEVDTTDDDKDDKNRYDEVNEADIYQGRLPVNLLREARSQLYDTYYLVKVSKSSTKGTVPLLGSVTIIETEGDNELRPAQDYAKQALEALEAIENKLRDLDKQSNNSSDHESNWTYTQLMGTLLAIKTSVQAYFVAIKAIEEFAPDNTRNNVSAQLEASVSSASKPERSSPSVGHATLDKAKSSSSKHALKIMRRIRSKLEGIDFGVNYRMGVSEQVARTIEQATSIDNLSLMYEGWTSWV
ncbi:hypothetical protein BDF20DRAFT_836780 [Mycotypha africana]|uniref:uncharacterized protein n=1 Tax=Mycotypha africana TaxID=64632 RepID=UPI002301A65D|nr:uncharacterized protein BDF20DRAFT_836780 [Mycotypha africana]KAI8975372.1 hypothetical protein BDF20DRAFT_836780 [Mycotypha africana]